MISMSRALLWLLSILYTHEQSRNFNIRLPWSYQAKVWILYACVQAIDVEKKEPFIKYYKLQYIYRSCVSLFAYVHCLRCACGPMVVFSSFFSFFALVSLEFYYYCFGFCLLTVVFLVCVVCFHFQWKSSSDHFNHVSYSQAP